MKILELFCGYGTASFALKQLGISYECVGYSDIDKYANQCFKQNHSTIQLTMHPPLEGLTFPQIKHKRVYPKELGDATKINTDELEDFDLLTGGFPCQAFSVAGKGLGELDTRGTLFREIIRIAEVKQPRYMLLENVKGLTNKNHKATFEKILSELARIGYFVHWKVLNTKDYGIPQNRERVWFVCFRRFAEYAKFEFPEKEELTIFLKDILEEEVDEKYYLSEKAIKGLLKHNENHEKKGTGFKWKPRELDSHASSLRANASFAPTDNSIIVMNSPKHSNNRVYSDEGISPTLRDMSQGGNRQPFIAAQRGRNPKNPSDRAAGTETVQRLEPKTDGTSNTISTVQKDNYVCDTLTIRKLTPKECFRLQGFLNDEVNLEGLSNTQQYKLAGNGQSVNVVKKIFERMFL